MNKKSVKTCFLKSAVFLLASLETRSPPLPPRVLSMTGVRNFVAGLARAGKGYGEIQETVNAAFGDLALKKAAIYKIMKKVKAGGDTADQRYQNPVKTKRTAALITAVEVAVKKDGWKTMAELMASTGACYGTIYTILTEELGLVKKSARWVPRLLTEAQKLERVRTCSNFIAAVCRHSLSMLDSIVTMDETMISYHTPEMKKQSKQWVLKGRPGPIKARVHASRTKQMVLAFFDSKGLIYTNIVPRGASVNSDYIVKALGSFLKNFRKKRPKMAARDWWFHWDNAPVHTATVVQNWLAARGIQVLELPPYSPDLAPADFFYFPKIKKELAGRHLTAKDFKKTWEGVAATVTKEDFAAAFRCWLERSEKCVSIGGDYVEKS